MSDMYRVQGAPNLPPGSQLPPIVINNIPPKQPWLSKATFRLLLLASIAVNVILGVLISTYFQGIFSQEKYISGPFTAPNKIAVIDVTGLISDLTVREPIRELETAADDKAVKGVILRLNSPGGEVFGTDRLYRAIERFKSRSKKPVVVLMEAVAASGAFWAAMPGDKIYAAENCVTGSIGVLLQTFVLTGLLKEWGVEPITFKTGELKDVGSMFREMNDADREELKSLMSGWYEQFLAVILKHRGEKIGGEEKLRELANGRVVLGKEAKELGFIDEIGYLDDAVDATKALAGVTGEVRVITYQRQPTVLELFSAKRQEPLFSRETLTSLQMPRILAMPPSYLATGVSDSAQ